MYGMRIYCIYGASSIETRHVDIVNKNTVLYIWASSIEIRHVDIYMEKHGMWIYIWGFVNRSTARIYMTSSIVTWHVVIFFLKKNKFSRIITRITDLSILG